MLFLNREKPVPLTFDRAIEELRELGAIKTPTPEQELRIHTLLLFIKKVAESTFPPQLKRKRTRPIPVKETR